MSQVESLHKEPVTNAWHTLGEPAESRGSRIWSGSSRGQDILNCNGLQKLYGLSNESHEILMRLLLHKLC